MQRTKSCCNFVVAWSRIETLSTRFAFGLFLQVILKKPSGGKVLDKLREDLENKKYLIEKFFNGRDVQVIVDFRSSTGRVGPIRTPSHDAHFSIYIDELIEAKGPNNERMHIGFIRLADLHTMYTAMGRRFFDRNIRFGLEEGEAVNQAITRSLKQIILDQSRSRKFLPSITTGLHSMPRSLSGTEAIGR